MALFAPLPRRPGSVALHLGCASFVGYLFVAMVMWGALYPNLYSMHWAVVCLICAGVLPVGFGVSRHAGILRNMLNSLHEHYKTLLCQYGLFVCLTISLLICLFEVVSWSPIQGWDSVDYWAFRAAVLSKAAFSEEPIVFPEWFHRHGLTCSLFLAWPVVIKDAFGSAEITVSSWLIFHISTALVIYGLARRLSLEAPMCGFFFLAALTLPLAENHALQPGYSEIVLTLGVICAVAMTYLAMVEKSISELYLAILCCCALSLLRNTGVINAALIITSLSLAFVLSMGLRQRIVLCSLLLLGAAIGAVYGWDFSIFGRRFAFLADEQVLILAGSTMQVAYPSYETVALNILASWFSNLSFSVLPLSLLITLGMIRSQVSMAKIFLFLYPLLGMVSMVLIQYSDYGLRFSMSNSDTGSSRLFLPFIVPGFLAIAASMQTLREEYRLG